MDTSHCLQYTISRDKHFIVDFSDFKSIADFIITLKYFAETGLLLLFLAIVRHAFTPVWVTNQQRVMASLEIVSLLRRAMRYLVFLHDIYGSRVQGRTQHISIRKGGSKKNSIPHLKADPENFGEGGVVLNKVEC